MKEETVGVESDLLRFASNVMWKEPQLLRQEKLFEREVESLAGEVHDIKLHHRADIDSLKLELEALKRFMAMAHPGFDPQFKRLKEEVQLEVFPE